MRLIEAHFGPHSGADAPKLEEVSLFIEKAESLEGSKLITSRRDLALHGRGGEQPIRKADVETRAELWFADPDAGLVDEYVAPKQPIKANCPALQAKEIIEKDTRG